MKNIKVENANKYIGDNKNETIFIDIEVNEVKIYGCRLATGKNGDFIAFPSQKAKNDKYYNHCWVSLTAAEVADIKAQALRIIDCE